MGYVTELFAKRLKELRETAGLTQAQLASELKVSRGAISYYEKGERTPDIEFLDSLAMYFDIPLDFAMGYTDNIKEEYRDMYEFYGLTDKACHELEFNPEMGHLISCILGHKDFYALKSIFEGAIKNHESFNTSQMGYISFLISDSLTKIISDSLWALRDLSLTPQEKDTLRIKHENNLKEFERLKKEWDETDKQNKENFEKEKEESIKRSREENAVRFQAKEKVHDKFHETVMHAEFVREHS